MRNYAEEYFAVLERLVGRPEDGRMMIPSSRPGLPGLCVLFFPDWPVDGVLSAFTLGVALGSHVEELGGHPELVISLRTTDPLWGQGLGILSESARDQALVSVGSTLVAPEPISAESPMTGFILTHPHHRGGEALRFRVADRDVVILEAHPLLPSELVAAREGGREELVKNLFGARYDVNRQAVSIATTVAESERFVECARHGRSQPRSCVDISSRSRSSGHSNPSASSSR
jgi:hypothetical protein